MATIETMPVALVTGASSGIGLATAQALRGAGFRVFGTGRRADGSTRDGITMLACDVTDDVSVAATVAAVLERAGRIDLLVNNAGFGMAGAAEETSLEQARQLFEVNLFGLIRMTQAVLPHMREARRGRIINISSAFGFMPAPYMAVYAASKHAVEGYSQSLDHEIRGFGIRAIAVEPANTRTAFDANLAYGDHHIDAYATTRPMVHFMLKGMMETGDEASVVADAVVAAALSSKPRLRWPAGKGKKFSLLRRFVPEDAFDKSLRKQLGL
ncbi:oxidoreductase [Sphingomonas pituitosa]|uniref:oxidoreductase n=1 Tax=Sphingomonas pituitosa TaxID=99597 RepID=UPI00082CBE50|nr:oxidoreductase [Sphingomonas pituitosa]